MTRKRISSEQGIGQPRKVSVTPRATNTPSTRSPAADMRSETAVSVHGARLCWVAVSLTLNAVIMLLWGGRHSQLPISPLPLFLQPASLLPSDFKLEMIT